MKQTTLVVVVFIMLSALIFFSRLRIHAETAKPRVTSNSVFPSPSVKGPTNPLIVVPQQKTLENNYHVYQTFNNCGPATLSMALSYFGIHKTQDELGKEIRPFQVANGDNDDKSVTFDELAEKAREYNLIAYHRPNGNIDLVKKFISQGIPVLTRTWLKKDEDIGHYRVVKGYDDLTEELIQDDSYQNKNLRYSYADFNEIWSKFGNEYLVILPSDKKAIAEAILKQDIDEKTAWKKEIEQVKTQLNSTPDDKYLRFNLSVANYKVGNYQESVDEFERVQDQLPFRTLWYQIEPIQAYFELGNYDKVLSISEKILNNQNRAFSELYLLRGQSYLKLNKPDLAKIEFEKAVFYNQNFASKVPVM